MLARLRHRIDEHVVAALALQSVPPDLGVVGVVVEQQGLMLYACCQKLVHASA